MQTVGERIRLERKRRGWNQKQLGQRAGGVSQHAISRCERKAISYSTSDYENGKTVVGAMNLLKIAKALSCDLTWLLTGEKGSGELKRYVWDPKNPYQSLARNFLLDIRTDDILLATKPEMYLSDLLGWFLNEVGNDRKKESAGEQKKAQKTRRVEADTKTAEVH